MHQSINCAACFDILEKYDGNTLFPLVYFYVFFVYFFESNLWKHVYNQFYSFFFLWWFFGSDRYLKTIQTTIVFYLCYYSTQRTSFQNIWFYIDLKSKLSFKLRWFQLSQLTSRWNELALLRICFVFPVKIKLFLRTYSLTRILCC